MIKVDINDVHSSDPLFAEYLSLHNIDVNRCIRVFIDKTEITAHLYDLDESGKKYVNKDYKSIWWNRAPIVVETFPRDQTILLPPIGPWPRYDP